MGGFCTVHQAWGETIYLFISTCQGHCLKNLVGLELSLPSFRKLNWSGVAFYECQASVTQY